jgi:tetratricopeptide (TPR) repeat protein
LPTKLSRYAEGVMEACWLLAIIMTPLFFNKYSSRIFEPDKATLLRTLALVIILAWVIKTIDEFQAMRKGNSKKFLFKSIFQVPIVAPVTLLAAAYIIATILSVTPKISFWGSYQRLQGLYTTLAYLVLLFAIIGNLKKESQVNRIITTAILVSLPVSLYGVLQKYGIDPIPWGGDVTGRIASHMGNPIFVAAFIILVFPLTVGRIIDSFRKILNESSGLTNQTARATVYIFIAALQIIAIFFTQSRGPWLGIFSGTFFLAVLFSLFWQKKWLTISLIVVAILATSFLVVLNMPNGPLKGLHSMGSFYRLGQLLDTQSRTARVRSLIWGGSFEMVTPHDPIEFPDGSVDNFNAIRPLFGYGPESMHMAYNPFYPPELAYVEKRNASPDRSHNETWDSMVFAGVFGLIAYLSVFTAVFYYGLKWLGLVDSNRKKWLFFGIYFGSGIISAVLFAQWQGIAFAGLGLPFGLILGLIIYLALIALFSKGVATQQYSDARSITLIVLLAAVVSHFAEINFGISIVATRTYFFVYAAMILAVGYTLPQQGEYILTEIDSKNQIKPSNRRKKSRRYQSSTGISNLLKSTLVGGLIGAFLLLPMVFEYTSNLWGMTSASKILWSSLTQVKEDVISYGVLALVLTTWVAAGVIFTSENKAITSVKQWWQTFTISLGIALFTALFYMFLLSGSLARLARMAPQNIQDVVTQTMGLEGLLTQYYAFLILGILILGFFLPEQWPGRSKNESFLGPILAIVGFIFVIWLSVTTNLKIIHADIAFKMAEPFASSRQWAVANVLYRRSIELSPDEDYYYLFLGRGSLEEAKTIEDPLQKEQAFLTAEADLIKAQNINPLNPDHTANLARLHSWWALQTSELNSRIERGQVSNQYYSRVTVLSPNNARLWDEWAILHLNVLKDEERAIEILSHSLEIDSKYDWTYAILGDLHNQAGQNQADESERQAAFELAAENYTKAIEFSPNNTNYFYALASAYQHLQDFDKVITTLEAGLEIAPESERWKISDNLTHFYLQINDSETALQYARQALQTAPTSEHERLNAIVDQLTP